MRETTRRSFLKRAAVAVGAVCLPVSLWPKNIETDLDVAKIGVDSKLLLIKKEVTRGVDLVPSSETLWITDFSTDKVYNIGKDGRLI